MMARRNICLCCGDSSMPMSANSFIPQGSASGNFGASPLSAVNLPDRVSRFDRAEVPDTTASYQSPVNIPMPLLDNQSASTSSENFPLPDSNLEQRNFIPEASPNSVQEIASPNQGGALGALTDPNTPPPPTQNPNDAGLTPLSSIKTASDLVQSPLDLGNLAPAAAGLGAVAEAAASKPPDQGVGISNPNVTVQPSTSGVTTTQASPSGSADSTSQGALPSSGFTSSYPKGSAAYNLQWLGQPTNYLTGDALKQYQDLTSKQSAWDDANPDRGGKAERTNPYDQQIRDFLDPYLKQYGSSSAQMQKISDQLANHTLAFDANGNTYDPSACHTFLGKVIPGLTAVMAAALIGPEILSSLGIGGGAVGTAGTVGGAGTAGSLAGSSTFADALLANAGTGAALDSTALAGLGDVAASGAGLTAGLEGALSGLATTLPTSITSGALESALAGTAAGTAGSLADSSSFADALMSNASTGAGFDSTAASGLADAAASGSGLTSGLSSSLADLAEAVPSSVTSGALDSALAGAASDAVQNLGGDTLQEIVSTAKKFPLPGLDLTSTAALADLASQFAKPLQLTDQQLQDLQKLPSSSDYLKKFINYAPLESLASKFLSMGSRGGGGSGGGAGGAGGGGGLSDLAASLLTAGGGRGAAPNLEQTLQQINPAVFSGRGYFGAKGGSAHNPKCYGHKDLMKFGGLPKHYHDAAPKGHKPEFITGLTGYYACGGGTGQSDDIPAMLHDGDYVMDAETVAQLGDGSSKAGREVLEGFMHKVPHSKAVGGSVVPAKIADGEFVFPSAFVTALGKGDNRAGAKILDGLREKLRAHKRSAPVTKIPPKAKSPLDYIEGKGK